MANEVSADAAAIRQTLANKMTDGELCETFGMSRVTSWRYRKAGILPFVRVAGQVFYLPQHVQSFLERTSRPIPVRSGRRRVA